MQDQLSRREYGEVKTFCDCLEDGFVSDMDTHIAHEGDSTIIQVRSCDGEGTMSAHEVFPGVMLAYNDFHLSQIESQFSMKEELFCIDHCREGRIEQAMEENAYTYVEAGDLKIDDRSRHEGRFELPLAHYHGITISMQVNIAEYSIKKAVKDFPVSVSALAHKFSQNGEPFIIRGLKTAEHIFSELYAVPRSVRKPYFQIKVLELLLFLEALEIPEEVQHRPYFYKSQVEKVKAARDLMVEDLSKHYTTQELAHRYDLSLTAFKACFKGVYGSPPFQYLRSYRMNKAAVLLRSTNDSVATVAYLVGYDSPSKFAVAFKQVMGKSPLDYRKQL